MSDGLIVGLIAVLCILACSLPAVLMALNDRRR